MVVQLIFWNIFYMVKDGMAVMSPDGKHLAPPVDIRNTRGLHLDA